MKIISTLLLLATLSTFISATKLRNNDQSSFGLAKSEGFLCPDLGWKTTPANKPGVYQVMWCYSGAGCGHANDYVYVTVQSSKTYVQCRATTANILKFAFGLALDVVQTVASGGASIGTVLDLVQVGLETTQDILTRSSEGDKGCYCFAERWESVTAIYATVVSDAKNSITIEVPPESLSQVNSEKIYANTLLKIRKDSCTNGNWKNRICNQYTYIRTKRVISWSDLADELAWLGDRQKAPGSLYVFNPNPSNPSCKDVGTRSVNFSKKWCFNNAGCVGKNDHITAAYNGNAYIRCRNAYDPNVPYIGTFMTTAFKSYITDSSSGCICYPDSFSTTIAVSVEDASGDWAWFYIPSSYFDKVGVDQIEGGVRLDVGNTSNGNWKKNIRDKYRYATTKYRYDWDELGDDIAWWGDRNANPDGLNKGN